MDNIKLIPKWVLFIYVFFIFLAILTLNNIYFVSGRIQILFYTMYTGISVMILMLLHKKEVELNQVVLVLITLAALVIAWFNVFIALPLFLIFPFIYSKKSSSFLKFFSCIIYCIVLLAFFVLLMARVIIPGKVITEENSPNNKYKAVVKVYDEGALGGSSSFEIHKIYNAVFKKVECVYSGSYVEKVDVKWIDNRYLLYSGRKFDVLKETWD